MPLFFSVVLAIFVIVAVQLATSLNTIAFNPQNFGMGMVLGLGIGIAIIAALKRALQP